MDHSGPVGCLSTILMTTRFDVWHDHGSSAAPSRPVNSKVLLIFARLPANRSEELEAEASVPAFDQFVRLTWRVCAQPCTPAHMG